MCCSFSTPYQGKADVHPLVHASGEGSVLLERVDNCITSDGFMTPTCLQSLYNISTTPATQRDNGLAVTGYTYQWPQYDDLAVSTSISCARRTKRLNPYVGRLS